MSDLRTSAYRALASASRVEILHLLQASQAPMTVDTIATEVGLHANTTREHLDRLVASGFVAGHNEHTGTRGRPRRLYQAVERAAAATVDSRARQHLARLLLEGYGRAMDAPTSTAEEAGRRWGDELVQAARADQDAARDRAAAPACEPVADPAWGQLAALEQHFEDLGFEPDLDQPSLRVTLRRCPLGDLARERTEIVCSVHLGLARGVLTSQGGPVVAERLEPFVGPRTCLLHLRRT